MLELNNIKNLKLNTSRTDRLVSILECLDVPSTNYKIFLFGSYANRCLNSDSDVDLLFIFPDDYLIPKKLDVNLKIKLDDDLGNRYLDITKCDMLFYNESKFFNICKSMPKSFEGKISSYMIKVKEVFQ